MRVSGNGEREPERLKRADEKMLLVEVGVEPLRLGKQGQRRIWKGGV